MKIITLGVFTASFLLLVNIHAKAADVCSELFLKSNPKLFTSFKLSKSSELRDAEEELSKTEKAINTLESRLADLQKKIENPLEHVYSYDAKRDFSSAKSKVERLQNEIQKIVAQLEGKEAIELKTSSSGSYKDLQSELKRVRAQIQKIETDLENGFIEVKGGFFSFFSDDTRSLTQKDRKKLSEDKADLVNKITDITGQMEKLKSLLEKDLLAEIPKIKSKKTSLESELANATEEKNKAEDVLNEKAKDKLKEFTADKEKSESELEALKNKKTKLSTEVKNLRDTERLKILEAMKELRKDPIADVAVEDLLGYYSLLNVTKSNKVTILTGNSDKKVSQPQLEQLQILIERLTKKNYYIVYDGHSRLAPFIAERAGQQGIAVYAHKSDGLNPNEVAINNDFLRMQAFANSKAVVVTPDSPAGMGLILEGQASYVLSTKEQDAYALEKWVDKLRSSGRTLGLSNRKLKIAKSADEIFEKSESSSDFYSSYSTSYSSSGSNELSDVTQVVTFNLLQQDYLTYESIVRIGSEASSFAAAMTQNRGTAGAVIFGSSQKEKESTPLIYESAYRLGRLGYAVATGGAGGAMETANSGAYNSGGPSIGVPIGGKNSLSGESTVASDKHTLTIGTSGYEERIPVLLGDGADSRQLIVIAPGGSGTIRELAVVLVRASGKEDSFDRIVFLDKQYYGDLVDWMQSYPIPQSLKDKIVLANSADDVEALGVQFQQDLQRNAIQAPRKDQPTYKEPSYFKFSYEKKDDDAETNHGWPSEPIDKKNKKKKGDSKSGNTNVAPRKKVSWDDD